MSDDWDDDVRELQHQIELLRAEIDQVKAADQPILVPGSAEFVLGASYLDHPKIYPPQLTLLRTIFCELDALTDYDKAKLAEWGSGFVHGPRPETGRWLAQPAPDRDYVSGTTPDILDRMAEMRHQGRPWFREPNLVLGRRAGKGHIAAIVCCKIVLTLLSLRDPQAYFGIPSLKRLRIPIFAANLEQAQFNLFGDIVTMMVDAPVFRPYLMKLTRDRLVFATPADLAHPDRPFEGSIEIVAKESTSASGRGAATPAQFFDEMAFIDPATSRAGADELYSAATPALDQFGEMAMVMELSSPKHQMGEFFQIHLRAREIDPRTGTAVFPETFTIQLPSWALYADADRATEIPVATAAEAATAPGLLDASGQPIHFPATGRAISSDDAQMRQAQKARPAEYAVERLGQWGTVDNPYLTEVQVDRLFEEYDGHILQPVEQGIHKIKYLIAVDAAEKHDSFVWIVGHSETPDGETAPHLVVDLVRTWKPAEHEDELDIEVVLDHLEDDIRAFRCETIKLDQHGGVQYKQALNRRLIGRPFGGHTPVGERPQTRPRNQTAATLLREGLQLARIHCYPHEELRRELRFLRETPGGAAAPTSGPVTHDDHAVCLMVLADMVFGTAEGQPIKDALAALPFGKGHNRRTPNPKDQATFNRLKSRKRGPGRGTMKGY